jgi:hypothetical protein
MSGPARSDAIPIGLLRGSTRFPQPVYRCGVATARAIKARHQWIQHGYGYTTKKTIVAAIAPRDPALRGEQATSATDVVGCLASTAVYPPPLDFRSCYSSPRVALNSLRPERRDHERLATPQDQQPGLSRTSRTPRGRSESSTSAIPRRSYRSRTSLATEVFPEPELPRITRSFVSRDPTAAPWVMPASCQRGCHRPTTDLSAPADS